MTHEEYKALKEEESEQTDWRDYFDKPRHFPIAAKDYPGLVYDAEKGKIVFDVEETSVEGQQKILEL